MKRLFVTRREKGGGRFKLFTGSASEGESRTDVDGSEDELSVCDSDSVTGGRGLDMSAQIAGASRDICRRKCPEFARADLAELDSGKYLSGRYSWLQLGVLVHFLTVVRSNPATMLACGRKKAHISTYHALSVVTDEAMKRERSLSVLSGREPNRRPLCRLQFAIMHDVSIISLTSFQLLLALGSSLDLHDLESSYEGKCMWEKPGLA
jgi:hypothetical protein